MSLRRTLAHLSKQGIQRTAILEPLSTLEAANVAIEEAYNDDNPRNALHKLHGISYFICRNRPSMATLLNYQLVVRKLHKQRTFAPQDIFPLTLAPFLQKFGDANYLQKSEIALETIDFINSLEGEEMHEELREKVLRQFRHSFVGVIQQAVMASDDTKHQDGPSLKTALLKEYYRLYGSLPVEDYHSILQTSLDAGDYVSLKQLATGDLSTQMVDGQLMPYTVSDTSRRMAVELLARYRDVHGIAKLWTNRSFTSYEVSIVADCCSTIEEKLEIMEVAMEKNEDLQLQVGDFDHIVDDIILSLNQTSRTRRKLQNDATDERSRKLNIHRVDISKFAERYITSDFLGYSSQVQMVFFNAFLKALTSVTNSTGVIHGLTLIPLRLVNTDLKETVMHSCARGHGSPLCATVIYNHIDHPSAQAEKWFNRATTIVHGRYSEAKTSRSDLYDKNDAATLNRYFSSSLNAEDTPGER